MFDIKEVGIRLSLMRKNAGLTQMELANRLGISYQAVSNWERGVSMPDLSNIGPLATELGVTVDEIIGNEKISSIIKGDDNVSDLNCEEFNAVSPLLSPERNMHLLENNVKSMAQKNKLNEIEDVDISSLCISQDEIDALAKAAAADGNVAMLSILKKHVSESAVDEIFDESIKAGQVANVAVLKKHVSGGALKVAFEECVKNNKVALVSVLMKNYIKDDEE